VRFGSPTPSDTFRQQRYKRKKKIEIARRLDMKGGILHPGEEEKTMIREITP